MSAPKSVWVKFFKLFRKIILFPIAGIFSVIFTILTVIILPIAYTPLIFYKYFIVTLSKFVIPDAVRVLNGVDNLMALGNVYKNPHMYVLIPQIFEGRLELDKVLLETQKRVIDKKREDGTFQFPELQYYIETLLGYSFFRPDKSFNLKNHVKVYPSKNEVIDKKKFNKIRQEVTATLFTPKKSPWQIVIVNNYRRFEDDKEHSILMWKIHHAMGDGNSTMQILFSSFGKLPPLQLPQFGRTFKEKILVNVSAYLNFVLLMLSYPFEAIYNPKRMFDLNSWQKAIEPKKIRSVLWSLEPIDVNDLKEISVANKVSITAVLMSMSIGAFRRMMEAKGVQTPKSIRCFFAHNLPNPSDGLTCTSMTSYIRIPLSEAKEPTMEMSKIINRKLIVALAIGHKIMSHIISAASELVPASFSFKRPVKNSFATFGFSSLPMPSLDVKMADCTLVEQYASLELIETSTAIALWCIKYKNKFYPTFAVQRTLLKNEEEVYKIEKYFMEEFHKLKANCLTP